MNPNQLKIQYNMKKGSKELIKALKAVEEAPARRGKLERAALAGGRTISFEAERRAPKDTGKASRTIRARVTGSARGVAFVAIGPSSRGYYLMYHEFGTSKMPARPFMRPAFEDKQHEAIRDMAAEYKRIIEWAAQRRSSR